MTIDEILKKLYDAKPVPVTSIYGDDIVMQLELDDVTTENEKLAEYIVENDLVDKILITASSYVSTDSLNEIIQEAMFYAIQDVVGVDKWCELKGRV